MNKAGVLFGGALAILDAAMIALAFRVAHYLRLATEYPAPVDPPPFHTYWGVLTIQVLTLLLVFFFYKLYHLKRGISQVDEFYSVFAAVSVGTVISIAITSFILPELNYPRLLIGYFWVFAIVFVTVGRSLHDVLQRELRRRGIDERRVLVVGAGEVGEMVLSQLGKAPDLGYRTIGVVCDTLDSEQFCGVPVLGQRSDLAGIVREQRVDEVIVALPEVSHSEMLDIISSCEMSNVSIKIFPDLFQIMASEVAIGDFSGLPLLSIRDASLRGWRLTLKRAVDVLFSAALLVALAPFMLLTAILIKLDSRGPVFYIQERVGLDGKPFQMVKFRSMKPDAEDQTGPVWAQEEDPRRTRIGAFIRRWSIDELPQFINVLVGQMSVVGPRAERPVFVEQFKRIVPRYMERHKEKAGLTGWAQVNGLRGDTSIVERTKYDLYYIENWSLWFDFKIMIKTLAVIMRGRNAY